MRIDPAVVERTISGILARAPDIRDTLSRREQTIRSRKRPSVDTDRYTQWTAQLLAAGIKPSKLDQERFIGKNDLVELNYLARGIGAARPVGRIHITEPSGRLAGYATGFLVAPGLAITNHHVFPTALDAAHAAIEFGYERNLQGNEVLGTKFGFQPEVFFFSFEPLDFALVAVRPLSLDRGKELSRFGWLRLNPSLGKIDPEQFVTIIQHPAGQPKQLSIRENKLIKFKGSKSRKQLGTDQWRPDPRIARSDQIPAAFYAGNDFDLGHVVKREDAYWGETEKQAESANADTFHLTNCSPQHMSFNRKSEGGVWGALEDAISNQGRDGAFEKMTIFAGPILDKKDREFRGIQIPSAFWKVVVSPRDNGKLAAYAFILEQKNLIKDLTEEINLQDFEVYQVPLKRIESRTRLEFPEIVQLADVLRKTRPDESLKIERAESIAL